jgi:hypothetical protein
VTGLIDELRDDLQVILGRADNLAYLIPPGRAELELAHLRRATEHATLVTLDILIATRTGLRPVAERRT